MERLAFWNERGGSLEAIYHILIHRQKKFFYLFTSATLATLHSLRSASRIPAIPALAKRATLQPLRGASRIPATPARLQPPPHHVQLYL
jgi:hypothetical protein